MQGGLERQRPPSQPYMHVPVQPEQAAGARVWVHDRPEAVAELDRLPLPEVGQLAPPLQDQQELGGPLDLPVPLLLPLSVLLLPCFRRGRGGSSLAQRVLVPGSLPDHDHAVLGCRTRAPDPADLILRLAAEVLVLVLVLRRGREAVGVHLLPLAGLELQLAVYPRDLPPLQHVLNLVELPEGLGIYLRECRRRRRRRRRCLLQRRCGLGGCASCVRCCHRRITRRPSGTFGLVLFCFLRSSFCLVLVRVAGLGLGCRQRGRRRSAPLLFSSIEPTATAANSGETEGGGGVERG